MTGQAAIAMQRCCLGTAQLGMPYGIANRSGKPTHKLAHQIIEKAWQMGVRTFDTAQDYGDSEAILGESLALLKGASPFRLITKFRLERDRRWSEQAIRDGVALSMERLKTKSIWAILIHSADLSGGVECGIVETLQRIQSQGWVQHLGASVYGPEAAKRILEHPAFSLVQAPYNLLDQRLSSEGVFALAKQLGKTVLCRSIFLQGLLTLSPADLPDHLREAEPYLAALTRIAEDEGISLKQFAVAFAFSCSEGFPVIFGAETPDQVEETFGYAESLPGKLPLEKIRKAANGVPERLINPALWRRS